MKKQICLTVILMGFYCLGHAQWQQVQGYSATGGASSLVVINDTLISSSTGNIYDGIPGLFTSTDHGATWSAKNTSLGHAAFPLITVGNYLYAGTPVGVYVSSDKGNNWTAKNNGLPSSFPVFDLFMNGTDFYVCGTGGIFHSMDNASSWENISLAGTIQATAVIAAGDTVISGIVSQTVAGVYKSTDNGANWILINNSSGLNDTRINTFALLYHKIFAASDGDLGTGNSYVSTDNGISWTAAAGLDDQGHNYPNNFIAFNNTIFLATANGVYKSFDYGLHWTNTGCSNAISLTITGDTLFAGTGFHGIWKRGLSEMAGVIEDINGLRGFSVYPNPASGKITIDLKQFLSPENTLAAIYNVQGLLVLQQPLQKNKTEVNISGLRKGVYMLKLTNNKMTEVTKLVVK